LKVVVVGSKEICAGFGLAGIKELHNKDDIPDMSAFIDGLIKREDVGIVIMDDGSYSALNWTLRKRLEVTAKPSVITVPDYGKRTVDSERLDALVKRALGFDLKKK